MVVLEWDSLFAFQWSGEVLGWYNATADPETLRELTGIIGAVKAQPPSEYQGAPDGGYPIELEFRAGDEIKGCYFHTRRAKIDGVWYEISSETYDRVLKLARGF